MGLYSPAVPDACCVNTRAGGLNDYDSSPRYEEQKIFSFDRIKPEEDVLANPLCISE
jgi:hypothetical protein